MSRSSCEGIFLVEGLLADHEVHWGEEVLLGTGDETIGTLGEGIGRLLGTLGRKTDHLQEAGKDVHGTATGLGHAEDGEEIKVRLHVLGLTSNTPVPWDRVVTLGKILVVEEVEASILHGLDTLGDGDHVGDTVTLLDGETDISVLEVVVVVLVGHQPLVHTELAAGLEHSVDFAIDANKLGGVDGGLDGVNGIEGVVRERHLLIRVSTVAR